MAGVLLGSKRQRRERTSMRRQRPKAMPKARLSKAIQTAATGVAFKRTFQMPAWVFGTATTNDFWRRFTPRFSDMPNHAEYGNLFDEYKMTGIKITFYPRQLNLNQPTNGTGAGTVNNQMYITIADASKEYELTPTGTYNQNTYNSMLEELGSKTKTIPFDKPISLYFKPQVFEEVGGVTGVGYKQSPSPWLQISSSLQPHHHGMHAFIHDYNFGNLNSAGFGTDVQYTFYFQCRGQA